MSEPYPFERTVCACARCVSKCKEFPGVCGTGDVERILDHLGVAPESAGEYFERGRPTAMMDVKKGILYLAPNITPKFSAGRCVFLTADDRCSVHAVAPVGCSHFDPHMSKREGDRRVWTVVQRQRQDPSYAALWLTLHDAARLDAYGKAAVRKLEQELTAPAV